MGSCNWSPKAFYKFRWRLPSRESCLEVCAATAHGVACRVFPIDSVSEMFVFFILLFPCAPSLVVRLVDALLGWMNYTRSSSARPVLSLTMGRANSSELPLSELASVVVPRFFFCTELVHRAPPQACHAHGSREIGILILPRLAVRVQ